MTEPQNFRSAFNGFHREDVVNHIAYMTTRHEMLVGQLRSEADALRTESAELRETLAAKEAEQNRVPELEETLARRDEEIFSLREELAAMKEAAAEQARQMAALQEELEEAKEAAAKPAAIEKSANHWDELRAYRRAETAERRAREHVNDLYDQATAALRSAGAALGDTNTSFEELAEKFRADLVAFMDALQSGSTALSSAAETLDGLRPEEIE